MIPPLPAAPRCRACLTAHLLSTALLLTVIAEAHGAETFRVLTWNLENYLDVPAGTRRAKPAPARAVICETLLALKPDVLAFQEMGSTNALLELRASLKAGGLDLPHWEHVSGADTNIHIAILSRFPFTARRPQTNDGFLLYGRHFRVSRGFAEVDVEVSPRYRFTLIAAHLKSRRPVPEADQADLREQEAALLRKKIEARLTASPDMNLVVLGDFNDTRDARPVKSVIGKGRLALVDTRPTEGVGGTPAARSASAPPRTIAWTYFYGKEDSYTRVDYLLLSRGMACEWDAEGTCVVTRPDWGLASDHRPLVATFFAEDR